MTAATRDPQLRAVSESIRRALPDDAVVMVMYSHDHLLLEIAVWAPAGLRRLWPPLARQWRVGLQERAYARARMRVPQYVGIKTHWAKGLDW